MFDKTLHYNPESYRSREAAGRTAIPNLHWLDDFIRTGEVQALEKNRWNEKQRLTECYRHLNQIPLRNSDDALTVN